MLTQWIINAAADASLYLLVALGFGLVYRTVHFFDFSCAACICVSPYVALAVQQASRESLIGPVICGTLSASAVAMGFDLSFFSRLRVRGASRSSFLLVSLGLFIVVRNLLGSVWGDQAILLGTPDRRSGYAVLGGLVTVLQLCSLICSALCSVGASILVRKTRLGLCIRAVGDDPVLARAVGIDEKWTIRKVYALAAVALGVAGLLLAADVGATPNLGFRPFLFGVVAVVLAGPFGALRLLVASLFVALVQNLALWVLGPEWQEGSIFGVFLVVVVARSFASRRLSARK